MTIFSVESKVEKLTGITFLYNEIIFRGNSTGSMCGTPNYIAPEILVKKGKQIYLKGTVHERDHVKFTTFQL